MIRVAQPCRISQVCRQLARDAGLVALTATHTSSDLPLLVISSMQRVLGHATSVCLRQVTDERIQQAVMVLGTQVRVLDMILALEAPLLIESNRYIYSLHSSLARPPKGTGAD